LGSRTWSVAPAAFLLLTSLPTFGQSVDEQSRKTARELGRQGQDLFKDGKYEEALDDFEHANAVMHLPVLGLLEAQCLEKLDRLQDAHKRYDMVAGMEYDATGLKPDQKQIQEDAKAKAAAALQLLVPRIPRLTVVVDGATTKYEILLDGQTLPANIVGRAVVSVNPGNHSVHVHTSTWSETQNANLAEGASQTIRFQAPAAASVPAHKAIEQARVAFQRGQCRLAIDSARQALQTNPGLTSAYQIIAICSCSLDDPDTATGAYVKLDERNKQLVRAVCQRNGIHF